MLYRLSFSFEFIKKTHPFFLYNIHHIVHFACNWILTDRLFLKVDREQFST